MSSLLDKLINQVVEGDCLEVLRCLPINCIDAILTDPPYGLSSGKTKIFNSIKDQTSGGFMGAVWDHGVPGVPFWEEMLRVAKPGAYLMAFGGTRTFHRLACTIEDAGWELKDTIMWLYGSGFPKSLNISKSLDSKLGKKREVIGKATYIHNRGKNSAFPKRPGEITAEESGRKKSQHSDNVYITAPASEQAKIFDGYGSALKPSFEPILLCMKPVDKTYAENALKWGVAGLNIDAGRIELKGEKQPTGSGKNDAWRRLEGRPIKRYEEKTTHHEGYSRPGNSMFTNKPKERSGPVDSKGRWPANVILSHSPECTEEACSPDCPVRMLDEQSGILKSGGGDKGNKKTVSHFGRGGVRPPTNHKPNSDGASRFFKCFPAEPRFAYCAKASPNERGKYNNHATVKPKKIIEYLLKLLKPPGDAIILDPFLGSGTTAVVCKEQGIEFIGIEKDPGSCEIARRRLDETKTSIQEESTDSWIETDSETV